MREDAGWDGQSQVPLASTLLARPAVQGHGCGRFKSFALYLNLNRAAKKTAA